jgi:hypothetical protein
MLKISFALFLSLALINPTFAAGIGADISTTLSAEKAAGIAKNLANPIANMIAVPIQYNYNRGVGFNSAGKVQSITFQPVMPFNLGGGDNFIVRPIVTAEWQNNVNGFTGSGIGNVQLETFYTPKPSSSLLWGIGPYLIAGSGSSGQFGSKQSGGGLSAVGLIQDDSWTAGLLLTQSWAIGGSKDAGTVNNFYYQPFVSYRTQSNWTFGLQTESTFNYDARRTSNQLSAPISKLVLVGDLPISLSAGPKYNASSVPGGPQGWGAVATVTFIFTK